MEFKFVVDTVIKNKAYPALAEWPARPYTAEWRQFGQHWPYTVPCELHEHCVTHDFAHQLILLNQFQNQTPAFYTVGLGFFNFDLDYIDLLPDTVLENLHNKKLKLLFYYHEGDNPKNIKQRLDQLCEQHQLDTNCYQFVSGNTLADSLSGFSWFPDHELLYWHRNRRHPGTPCHEQKRNKQFTLLSRTHKWWRATVVADLQQSGILDNSYWSYRTNISNDDRPENNPIEIDLLNLRSTVEKFVEQAPYVCDQLTSDQHNDHSQLVTQHFSDSYCSIVLETHFDADASDSAFLTEKTFKCLKHGHPFVLVGGPGSLQALRNLGYRTFDHAIDNSYDLEINNTKRWQLIKQAIEQIKSKNMHEWFLSCLPDIKHNQQLFLSSKKDRLNMLFNKLVPNS